MRRLARLETGAVSPALVEYPVKPIDSAERGYLSWGALAASRGTLPFTFPSWIASYLTHIEPGQRTQVLVGTTADGIVSALPLIRDRGRMCGLPVRRLRPPAAIAVPDRFDLTVAAGYADGAADALLAHLQARRDWDVLELVDLPDDGPGARLAMLAGQAEEGPEEKVALADKVALAVQVVMEDLRSTKAMSIWRSECGQSSELLLKAKRRVCTSMGRRKLA